MTDKEKEAREAQVPALDYFAVNTRKCGWWPVSTVMARHVTHQLDRLIAPRWVRFVDLSGATVRVRAVEITDVTQCSADQRAERRALGKLLQEERGDEPW